MRNCEICEGTVFSIPLWNGRNAVGKILYVSKRFGDFSRIAIFKKYLDQYDLKNELPGGQEAFLTPSLSVPTKGIKDMPWQHLGQFQVNQDELKMTNHISEDRLCQQDNIIREKMALDYVHFVKANISFCGAVAGLADQLIAFKDGCSPEEGKFKTQDYKVVIGDILVIPLRCGIFVPAKIVYASEYPFVYRKALIKIYKKALPNMEMPTHLGSDYFSPVRWVHAAHLTDGRWPRIGNEAVTMEEKKLSLHVDSGQLFQGDQYLRVATDEEIRSMLSNSVLWHAGWVEEKVHEWFGCAPRCIPKNVPEKREETSELWLKSTEWMAQMVRSRSWAMAQKALEFAIEADYLELDECYEALAAGEVVAAAMGKPAKDLPGEAKKWAEKHRSSIDSDLIKLAANALVRIRKNSELSGEVAESELMAPWKKLMSSLAKRLKT
jgi:hypothetical protein